MAPAGSQLFCEFVNGRYEEYANCHRYDQSAINILLANAYEYNITKYISRLGPEGALIIREADFHLTEQNFSCTPH
ncbi:hypothetical protein OESDEN_06434 [Oesophagostomum dentatum]|uniref:Uncharacterized protein n=1 Tax=Oesophagostomum dentatum TaxID=61180 RepID=A0A0B1TCW8_OESDE|nr:hypothetical protein OESDEN_06434 [Oesophagostomum dentatum]